MPSNTRTTVILSPSLIQEVGTRLQKTGVKYYILFQLLIKTGIPCSQFLNKKVSDVRGKKTISYCRRNTNVVENIPLDDEMQRELALYTSSMAADSYLFPANSKNTPISIYLFQRRLSSISEELHIPEIRVRSLIKTYQYQEYLKGGVAQKQIKQILHKGSKNRLEAYFGAPLPAADTLLPETFMYDLNRGFQDLLECFQNRHNDLTYPEAQALLSLLDEIKRRKDMLDHSH